MAKKQKITTEEAQRVMKAANTDGDLMARLIGKAEDSDDVMREWIDKQDAPAAKKEKSGPKADTTYAPPDAEMAVTIEEIERSVKVSSCAVDAMIAGLRMRLTFQTQQPQLLLAWIKDRDPDAAVYTDLRSESRGRGPKVRMKVNQLMVKTGPFAKISFIGMANDTQHNIEVGQMKMAEVVAALQQLKETLPPEVLDLLEPEALKADGGFHLQTFDEDDTFAIEFTAGDNNRNYFEMIASK